MNKSQILLIFTIGAIIFRISFFFLPVDISINNIKILSITYTIIYLLNFYLFLLFLKKNKSLNIKLFPIVLLIISYLSSYFKKFLPMNFLENMNLTEYEFVVFFQTGLLLINLIFHTIGQISIGIQLRKNHIKTIGTILIISTILELIIPNSLAFFSQKSFYYSSGVFSLIPLLLLAWYYLSSKKLSITQG